MMRKSVQNVQKRGITGYAYKVAKGMMPKISGKLNVPTVNCQVQFERHLRILRLTVYSQRLRELP